MQSIFDTNIESEYVIGQTDQIPSPSPIVFRRLVTANIDRMIELAGAPSRLCPHCKTHKTREVVRLMLDRGIENHKCATIAEAEMLALAGANKVLLAFQPVGPNIQRFVELSRTFPQTEFSTIVDHPQIVDSIASAGTVENLEIGLLVDLETGMGRTGILPGEAAMDLVEMIMSTEGVSFKGLHWYNGHHRQPNFDERNQLVLQAWKSCIQFRDRLLMNGIPVDRIVAGGIGSFAIIAGTGEPDLQVSPGTATYFDVDVAERFPELKLHCALAILTRVVSVNRAGFLTLDVGHKSCAADMPAGCRLYFPQLPDAVEVAHTEEHCVIKSKSADDFEIGSALLCFPRHVCPTSAVHRQAYVIENGQWVDTWENVGRDRMLTI